MFTFWLWNWALRSTKLRLWHLWSIERRLWTTKLWLWVTELRRVINHINQICRNSLRIEIPKATIDRHRIPKISISRDLIKWWFSLWFVTRWISMQLAAFICNVAYNFTICANRSLFLRISPFSTLMVMISSLIILISTLIALITLRMIGIVCI